MIIYKILYILYSIQLMLNYVHEAILLSAESNVNIVIQIIMQIHCLIIIIIIINVYLIISIILLTSYLTNKFYYFNLNHYYYELFTKIFYLFDIDIVYNLYNIWALL